MHKNYLNFFFILIQKPQPPNRSTVSTELKVTDGQQPPYAVVAKIY